MILLSPSKCFKIILVSPVGEEKDLCKDNNKNVNKSCENLHAKSEIKNSLKNLKYPTFTKCQYFNTVCTLIFL